MNMTLLKSVTSSLLGTAVLLTAATAPVLAASPAAAKPVPAVQAQKPQTAGVVFTPKVMSVSTKEFEGKVTIPVISGLKDKAFEAKLNADLLKEAQTGLAEGQKAGKQDAAEAKNTAGSRARTHSIFPTRYTRQASSCLSPSRHTSILAERMA